MTTPEIQRPHRRLVTHAIYEIDLPEQAAEIRELIGWPATLALVEAFGGIGIVVPRQYDADCQLAQLLGEEATQALIGRYGGDTLYIAKLHRAMMAARNIEIDRRFSDPKNPVPAWKLALEYRLSERQIWNILKDPSTLRDHQPGLFD